MLRGKLRSVRAGWFILYRAFFEYVFYCYASLAYIAYWGGGVFANKKVVCKKGLANSYADDSNILTSAEVRRSIGFLQWHKSIRQTRGDDSPTDRLESSSVGHYVLDIILFK